MKETQTFLSKEKCTAQILDWK